jgi:hypothetical protein
VVFKNDFGEKDSGFFGVIQGKEWRGVASVEVWGELQKKRVYRTMDVEETNHSMR